MGKITTFYSYKGGAGRTMAAVNVGYALAERSRAVLIADLDLEAPGVRSFLAANATLVGAESEVDFLRILESGALPAKDQYEVWRFPSGVEVSVLTPRADDDGYWHRLSAFDWNDFFASFTGAAFLGALRDRWMADFDHVVIDSRTGVSDVGGVTTVALPDNLVCLTPLNEQSVDGTRRTLAGIQYNRRHWGEDRHPLLVLPVPSRVDNGEQESKREWLQRFAEELGSFSETWLPSSVEPGLVTELTQIPYVPYYSYGERMAMLEVVRASQDSVAGRYLLITDLIAGDFRNASAILERRGSGDIEVDSKSVTLERLNREFALLTGSGRSEFLQIAARSAGQSSTPMSWKEARALSHLERLESAGLVESSGEGVRASSLALDIPEVRDWLAVARTYVDWLDEIRSKDREPFASVDARMLGRSIDRMRDSHLLRSEEQLILDMAASNVSGLTGRRSVFEVLSDRRTARVIGLAAAVGAVVGAYFASLFLVVVQGGAVLGALWFAAIAFSTAMVREHREWRVLSEMRESYNGSASRPDLRAMVRRSVSSGLHFEWTSEHVAVASAGIATAGDYIVLIAAEHGAVLAFGRRADIDRLASPRGRLMAGFPDVTEVLVQWAGL